MFWINDVVHRDSGKWYIPKNYKELVAKGEKFDVYDDQDTEFERLLRDAKITLDDLIPCEYAIACGDAGCSFLEPFVSPEEAFQFIDEKKDVMTFTWRTNPELIKKFPTIKRMTKRYWKELGEGAGASSQKDFSFKGYEVLERLVKPHATSAHVGVPKDWIGCRVAIVRLDEGSESIDSV